jgi:hypothetical protein
MGGQAGLAGFGFGENFKARGLDKDHSSRERES